MTVPNPPSGFATADMDAIFADLLLKADIEYRLYLRQHMPTSWQQYVNYYIDPANRPSASPNPTYSYKTAAAALKAAAGTLQKVYIVDPGTAGNLTFNNCTTTGAASGGNQIDQRAFSALYAGQVIDLNIACDTGVTLSTVPTGGKVTVVWN